MDPSVDLAMPQSLSAVFIHLVFSTKERYPFLTDQSLREGAHAYIGEISKRLGCSPLCIGGVADHVHILARLGREVRQSDWVKELKRVSNPWINEHLSVNGKFAWQSGYGAFSVSQSKVEEVREYIRRQEEHHQRMSFQEEYREFMNRHGIEWDERYVWD